MRMKNTRILLASRPQGLPTRDNWTIETAEAPDLAQQREIAESFKIYDATQEANPGVCRFTYTLRPLRSGVEEFPAVAASYFDVKAGKYVVEFAYGSTKAVQPEGT